MKSNDKNPNLISIIEIPICQIQTKSRVSPRKMIIRRPVPLLVLVPGCTAPDLKLRTVGFRTASGVQTEGLVVEFNAATGE